jgi:FdhD protein
VSSSDPEVRELILNRYRNGVVELVQDSVAVEEPLEIRVRGASIAVTMRTPGHDAELAAGFLLSEGLIKHRDEIVEIAPCPTAENPGNILNVFLKGDAAIDLQKLSRHVFASSSCGICGKASIESVHQHFAPVSSRLQLRPAVLLELPDKLRQFQSTFDRTGGLHAAGLFDTHGNLLLAREDVGRHNALDKVLGHALLENWLPLHAAVLLVSGRASFEIVQKALSAGIAFVAAVSAPSSLAVQLASESGQTLIGFLRTNAFNIYSNPSRINQDLI